MFLASNKPGVVTVLKVQVKEDTDDQKVLKHVHSVYNDIGIKDLTVQLEVHV
jgi:zinc transporter 5/7